MYSAFSDQFNEEKGYSECEEDEGFKSSEDELAQSDREEIEQALYAQIHYCQDDCVEDDDQKFDFKYSENGQIIDNTIQLKDKQFNVKSPSKSKKKNSSEKKIDRSKARYHRINNVSEKSSISKSKSNKKDEVIVVNSQSSDIDVEKINSQSSGSDAEIIDSESSDSNAGYLDSDDEINISSDIDYDIDSDCMMLDESCEDMGDIVLNIDHNQRKMVKNLTVRNIKEQDDADKWGIIDQDRFTGNPMLRRYHKPLSVRCHNCNELGHLSKVCPQPKKVIACYLCGEEGHNGKFCINPVCFNCSKPGHIIADCTGPRRSRYTDCHRCQMLGHTSYECPELWRQFHMTTLHGQLIKAKRRQNSRKHCSNCAAEDHFDFECDEERMDRHSLPSYPFISQYRNNDVKVAKRRRDINEDNNCQVPTKRRKIDEDFKRSLLKESDFKRSLPKESDFKRSLPKEEADDDFLEKCLNDLNNEGKIKKKKKKFKEREKKEDNFRKMMDMDENTFRNKKNNNKINRKGKISNSRDKKKQKKKKTVILERGNNVSVTLQVSKKKKKKSKKNNKDRKKTQDNSNKGFKINNGYYKKNR